jgi:glucan biosynthesis protein C
LVSVVCYTIFYILIPKSLNMQEAMTMMSAPPAIDKNQMILSLLQAFIAVHMSIAALLIGRRYFNKQSSIVRMISDSSYWIYIVHLPLLWCIQFVLLDYDWPMLVEFFVSTFSTIIIGFVSYLIFVRWTPVGWLLNGKK